MERRTDMIETVTLSEAAMLVREKMTSRKKQAKEFRI